MPMNLGPIELLFVLALWLLPLAVVAWFLWAVLSIRSALQRIEQRLERLESRYQ